MECTLACGLIALILPVVAMVLGHSNSTARDAAMEAEAQRVIRGHARQWMGAEANDGSEWLVWAHGISGQCLGRVELELHQKGVNLHQGQKVRYLVVLEPAKDAATDHEGPLRQLKLRLEYPAAAPATRRRRIELYARYNP